MFCQNGTTYLEVSLHSENRTEVETFSTFCSVSLQFVKYASLPLGLAIILLTTSAFIALKSRFKMTGNGTGVIFMAVVTLDFLNGWLCFRLFEQLGFRKIISFDGDTTRLTLEWGTWLILYTSWVLKFFLCAYQLHRFLVGSLNVSWYPARPNLSRAPTPLSRRAGYAVVAVSLLWSLAQMTVMYLVSYYNIKHVSVPFLGIQTLALFAVSWLVAGLYIFTRYHPSCSPLERFITSTIGLNCVFTLLADTFLTYGDLSCLFGYATPSYMKPMCYCILARFLSYSDSIFFSAALFRSSVVRGCFLEAARGHLTRRPEQRGQLSGEKTLSEDDMNSYPVNADTRNRSNFRSVTINDE